MTIPESGGRTRRALEAAMRTLLRQKPLDQLRVREITELCGLRRQSFYYHFKDVYDLFAWSVRQEQDCLRARQEDCLTWRQAVGVLLERTAEERPFYQAVLRNQGRAGLREVLSLSGILEAVLAYYRGRSGAAPDPEADRSRLRCWEAVLLSLLEGWIQEDPDLRPEELLPMLEEGMRQSAGGDTWRTLWQQEASRRREALPPDS